MTDNNCSRTLFYCLLLVLVWLPLPFGSKPLWAMSVFQIMIWLLTLGWLVGYAAGYQEITRSFRRGVPVMVLIFIVGLWQLCQSLQLPAEIVQTVSPISYRHHEAAATALGLAVPSKMTLSLDPFATHTHALLTFAYGLLFALILLVVDELRRVKLLAWAMVIAGAGQAMFGLISTLSGLELSFFIPKEHGKGVATGTFVNRNNLAGHLEMTLAIGVGLLLYRLNDKPSHGWREFFYETLKTLMSSKVLLRVVLAAMVIALVMTHSRMGNTAFFSSLLVTVLLYAFSRKKLSRGMIVLFVSLILVDTAIVSQWFGVEKLVERIEQTSLATETRDDVNPVTLEILNDFMATGSGAGSYYTTLPSYHDGSWRGFYDLAHNDYLQFPLEFGLPAFLLLAVAVLFTCQQSILAMRKRRNLLSIGMGFAATMGILSILIHSAVDFNLQIPANAAYFVVLMAIAFLARSVNGRDIN